MEKQAPQRHPSTLEPGTLVGVAEVAQPGTGLHLGIVSNRVDEYGLPLVISVSQRTGVVQEEAWLGFTSGKPANIFDDDPATRARALAQAQSALWKPWPVDPAHRDQFAMWARGPVMSSPSPASNPGPQSNVIAMAAVAVIAGALVLLIASESKPKSKKV